MPPVAQLTLAYVAGLWIGLVTDVPLAGGAALTVCALPLQFRGAWWGNLGVVLALGICVGALRAHDLARSCRSLWRPGPQAVMLRVHDAVGRRGTTSGTVLHDAAGCDGTLKLRYSGDSVPAGATTVVVGVYRSGGVLRVSHARVLEQPRAWRFAVRDRIARRVRQLYGARAGFVEALVLGRRDDIDPEIRTSFTQAGLAHLLAISGLHVGIIAGWLVTLFTLVGLRRRAWLWAVMGTWTYVGLLGLPAPATRAASFITIYAVARARQRHPPASAVLAVAILVVVTIEPAAVTSVGAWLSVAAVWGTRWGTGRLQPRWRHHAVVRLGAASFGATLTTAPITAFAFGTVAPAGLVANIVAVPLAGVAVPAVFASLVPLGGVFAGGAGLVLAALEGTAVLAGAIPGGHLARAPGLWFAAPWVIFLLLVVWLRRRRRILAAIAGLTWTLVIVGSTARDRLGELVIHVLDVGQGDAIAVRTPRGQWVLVDAGPRSLAGDAGYRVVLPFLRRRSVDRLAALVVSHGDADHLGGVPTVMRALDPGMVLEPGQPLATPLYREHLAAVDAGGVAWRAARTGDTLVIDSVTLAVVHPSPRWMKTSLEPNENSVVLRLSYGCFDAVLSGDIGWPAESALVSSIGQADLLKIGHHGSAGGTTTAWLDAVRPSAAVISVGRNRYGHPAPRVLQRLRAQGIAIFRTDRGGTVTIRTDGRYLLINQGQPTTLEEKLRCRVRRLLRSKGSSWSRSACIQAPPVSFPICSMTSR